MADLYTVSIIRFKDVRDDRGIAFFAAYVENSNWLDFTKLTDW